MSTSFNAEVTNPVANSEGRNPPSDDVVTNPFEDDIIVNLREVIILHELAISQVRAAQEQSEIMERVNSWMEKIPAEENPQPIEKEDFSDRTITLHRRNHLDYTGYPMSVEFIDSEFGIDAAAITEYESIGVRFMIKIIRKIEILDGLEGISSTDPTQAITRIMTASRQHDEAGLPNGHKFWDQQVVVPVITEAIRIFRETVFEGEEKGNEEPDNDEEASDQANKEESKIEELLDWFCLPGDLSRPYVMSGIEVPLDDEYNLGFDLFQLFRMGSQMSSNLRAYHNESSPLKIDPRIFQGLIAVIRPCATEPSGLQNRSHRMLHALHRLAPTLRIYSRYLWQTHNILTGQLPPYANFETWLPVLLYEGSEWHFFLAKTREGEMTAVRIRCSADTSSVVGCKKLLSFLIVLLFWAKYIHWMWVIVDVFQSFREFDEIWGSAIAATITRMVEDVNLEELCKSLPCGQIPV